LTDVKNGTSLSGVSSIGTELRLRKLAKILKLLGCFKQTPVPVAAGQLIILLTCSDIPLVISGTF